MASQTRRQSSPFQYWWWRFRRLPTSAILLLDSIFVLVILLFSQVSLPSIPNEWYPGGVKTYPTARNPFMKTDTPLPTLSVPSPVPMPVEQPAAQPQEIIGVAAPEGQDTGVEQVIPSETPTDIPVEPTPWPTANNATVEAWMTAPPSTSTPSPAPGEPGFKESFEPQPECNFFIGYVGPKRFYCDSVYATQTATAQ